MSELLDQALLAHGGLDRWRAATAIRARASASGLVFSSKGYGEALKDVGVTVSTREQLTTLDRFLTPGNRAICTPVRTVIENEAHQALASRNDPLAAFDGHVGDTPWDNLHLAYFLGYALWNYFNEPFYLTLPGFETEELGPWEESGETWRRLRVVFPDAIATHSKEQTFYFNAEGLLVRKDYAPYVRGNLPAAHYLLEHQSVDGLILPAKRRIYRRGADGQRIADALLIAVDYADFRVA